MTDKAKDETKAEADEPKRTSKKSEDPNAQKDAHGDVIETLTDDPETQAVFVTERKLQTEAEVARGNSEQG